MPISNEDAEFLTLGIQYYAAGRSAAWAGLMPVCGNLCHHAVEMLLKAGLSRKHSLAELKKNPFSHSLPYIWETFKNEFPSPDLAQFDSTITDLHGFVDIRYPDQVVTGGAQMLLDWGPPSFARAGTSSPPLYKFDMHEVDRLVSKIFDVSSRVLKTFISRLKPDVQEMLARNNPVAAQLLPPSS